MDEIVVEEGVIFKNDCENTMIMWTEAFKIMHSKERGSLQDRGLRLGDI